MLIPRRKFLTGATALAAYAALPPAAEALTQSQREVLLGASNALPVLWFDASNAASISSTVGSVDRWADLSGGNNNATQTGTARPTIATAAQNGLNTIAFAAALSQNFSLDRPINLDATGHTLFVVMRRVTTGAFMCAIGGTGNKYYGVWFSDNKVYTKNSTYLIAGTAHAVTTYNQITFSLSSTNVGAIYFNGVADTITTTTPSITGNVSLIGSGSVLGFSNGNIAELILFKDGLSLPVRQYWQTYLKTKWGTP